MAKTNLPEPTDKPVSRRLMKNRVPLVYFILITFIFCTVFYWQNNRLEAKERESRMMALATNDCPPPPVVQYRMNQYQFTRPLLLSDGRKESTELNGLKNELANLILSKKQTGQIINASVYVRRLNDSKWISVNDDEWYVPGSLLKVPIMMTFLKESEMVPGLLNREVYYSKVPSDMSYQTFTSDSIKTGMKYTIGRLLYFMVARSDNHATFLLNEQLPVPVFNKLFTDLGLPKPDVYSNDYLITASGYSKFLRVLYNATFINSEHADFALTLLSESTFTKGLVEGLPAGTKIVHKFGEMGVLAGDMHHQLHDSGIIFLDDNPYLITVMTRGDHVEMLPGVISEISKRVYNSMIQLKKNS